MCGVILYESVAAVIASSHMVAGKPESHIKALVLFATVLLNLSAKPFNSGVYGGAVSNTIFSYFMTSENFPPIYSVPLSDLT